MRLPVLLLLASVFVGCRSTPSARAVAGPRFSDSDRIVIAPDDSIAILPSENGRPASPRYPVAEREAGIGAWPVVAYVIDTMGRIEPRTLTFLPPAPPRNFQTELCAWARLARFTPLRANGTARRALMVEPFSFEVSGGDRRPMPDPEPIRQRLRTLGPAAAIAELEPLPHCP